MTILPGLTTTVKERIGPFVRELRSSDVRAIALFPTVLLPEERRSLYDELARIEGLRIPHVHVRTDMDRGEIVYLAERFSSSLFNIHPRRSTHPYPDVPPDFADRFFVENVMVPPEDEELELLGGICPDYSHLENARLQGRAEQVAAVERQLLRFPIGCCHVSAIRVGDPNRWSGEWDHHNFIELHDFDYLRRYTPVLPDRYISLELENPLHQQLEAARYIERLLHGVGMPRVTDVKG